MRPPNALNACVASPESLRGYADFARLRLSEQARFAEALTQERSNDGSPHRTAPARDRRPEPTLVASLHYARLVSHWLGWSHSDAVSSAGRISKVRRQSERDGWSRFCLAWC